MVAVLVLARLCEPCSELHIAEDRRTALEDRLALPAALVNDDRLHRALDRLLPHKTRLEQHLVTRLGELFALDYDLLLYDVTSTYFEARRRSIRWPSAGTAAITGRTVSRCVWPWWSRARACPWGTSCSPATALGTMEARYGLAQRIRVMDRPMTSEDNLSWLRGPGRRYLVGTPKSELRKWARQIAEAQDWQAVRAGVEAKQCLGADGAETFVLVRSIERREKERAMHDRFRKRIEASLARPERRVRHARRPLDRGRLERQIGRLLALNSRAAGRYVVELVPDSGVAAGVRVQWSGAHSSPLLQQAHSSHSGRAVRTSPTGARGTCGAPTCN